MAAPERKDTWLRVQSRHFTLIGNASEKEIRKVGLRLEQFREAVSRFFNQAGNHPSIPITVVVFKDEKSYRPYKPLYQGEPSNVSGYFQSGDDKAYITLVADWNIANPYSIIFHEYVHLLTSGGAWQLPSWLSEGIAEYYSTFEITGRDKKVIIGKTIANHVRLLRQIEFLPLSTIFTVDQASPLYNVSQKKNIFYAESWALVHYLLLGNDGKRQAQFYHFIDLLTSGKPVDAGFREAFRTDYSTIEQELKNYIHRTAFPSRELKLDQKLEFDIGMQTAPLSEAETQSYLGDLLWHIHRPQEAIAFLQRAIDLDPNLAAAHFSLGRLRLREERYSEARKHFQQAIAANSQDHLAHYYYAYSMQWEQVDETRFVTHFSEESVKAMRASLEEARRLAPDFPDTYKQLAFINLVLNENLEESVNLLKRALAIAPTREDIAHTLAQVYLRQQNFKAARQTIEPIANSGVKTENRERAKSLLEVIVRVEAEMARFNAERQAQGNQAQSSTATTPSSTLAAPGRRFEGEQVRGLLTRIDCTDSSITLTIKSGARVYKFHSPKLGETIFVRYTREIPMTITCGPINPAKPVIVTYRKSADAGSKFDGEPIGVEFLKHEGQ